MVSDLSAGGGFSPSRWRRDFSVELVHSHRLAVLFEDVGEHGRKTPPRAQADEILKQYPTLRVTRLHDMLRDRGFKGAVRTLRQYVAAVRPTPKREAFLRLQPLIGEQAQIDWAYVGDAAVAGGNRPLWLFVIVLSWSRAMWGELVYDLGASSPSRPHSKSASIPTAALTSSLRAIPAPASRRYPAAPALRTR